MNHFNLNEVPFEIIQIGEELWDSEEGFKSFLVQQGINNTSHVTQEQWDNALKAIKLLEEEE